MGDLVRTKYGCVCCCLGYFLLVIVHAFWGVGGSYDILAGQSFEPGTSGGISAYFQVQMIAIPIHVVAYKGGAGILDGSAGGDDFFDAHQSGCFLNGIDNIGVHFHLT